jgi:hypothetical protein
MQFVLALLGVFLLGFSYEAWNALKRRVLSQWENKKADKDGSSEEQRQTDDTKKGVRPPSVSSAKTVVEEDDMKKKWVLEGTSGGNQLESQSHDKKDTLKWYQLFISPDLIRTGFNFVGLLISCN